LSAPAIADIWDDSETGLRKAFRQRRCGPLLARESFHPPYFHEVAMNQKMVVGVSLALGILISIASGCGGEPLSTREKGTLGGGAAGAAGGALVGSAVGHPGAGAAIGGAGGAATGYAIGNEQQNQETEQQQNASY
jgi:hypothetical protein